MVEGEAAQWQERLAELHAEYFRDADPLAPVRLEVIDRATDDALQRLTEAGLLARTTRGARPLLPESEKDAGPTRPSEEERAQAAANRAQATRKLSLARLLGEGGFGEEARTPLLEAAQALGRALAIEHRLPELASLADILPAPLSSLWLDALPQLRAFSTDAAQPWKPLADRMAAFG